MDATGREAGRGAYLHRSEECVREAARRGALARALKAPLEPSEAARLVEQIRMAVGETTK
jgi:predicted RNA-binding protein YlxR (DUF448 family)